MMARMNARAKELETTVEQLQAKLKELEGRCSEEATCRAALEKLREEFVRRFSLAFVTQIEQSLPAPPPGPRGPVAQLAAQHVHA